MPLSPPPALDIGATAAKRVQEEEGGEGMKSGVSGALIKTSNTRKPEKLSALLA